MSRQRVSDAGFSLVEVLAALAVFSVAAMALINLSTEAASGTRHMQMRFLASIVADNQMATTLTDPRAISAGVLTGNAEQRGQRLEWVRTVAPTSRDKLFAITIAVTDPASGQELARIQTLHLQQAPLPDTEDTGDDE